MANKTTQRERDASGRYDLTNLEQRCVCGRKAGEHLAKRPHDCEEAGCEGFRAAIAKAEGR